MRAIRSGASNPIFACAEFVVSESSPSFPQVFIPQYRGIYFFARSFKNPFKMGSFEDLTYFAGVL